MAGPLNPINDLALRRVQEEAARSGTFKVEGSLQTGLKFVLQGGPEHGKVFSTYAELRGFLKERNFRMREVFAPGLPQPGSGWYRYPFLNLLGEQWAQEVKGKPGRYGRGVFGHAVREGWGLGSAADANALADALQRGGFPVIDSDSGSVLRLMAGETEANYDEIVNFLRRRFGLTIGRGSKVDKRLKALMSMRGVGMAEMVDEGAGVGRFKVGVFDRKEIETMQHLMGQRWGSAKLAQRATEGQSVIRGSVVRHQIEQMRAEAAALHGVVGQDMASIRVRLRGSQLLKEADELEKQLAGGRIVGNVRMLGLDVIDMASGKARRLQGQLKGDALVMEDEAFDRLTGGKKLDVITASWNIKTDLKMTKARLFTLESHMPHDVYLDVQSVSSFPQFFPVDSMKQKMLDDFDSVISTGTRFDEMKGGLIRMVGEVDALAADERIYQGLDPVAKAAKRAEIEKAAAYGRDITETIRLGIDPRERPAVMSQFLTSYRRYLLAERKGGFFPRMRVPDAMAAGIRTDWSVKEGAIRFSRSQGTWVMHGKTFGELYKSFGGADLDDTLVNLLRWDEQSKSVKAVLFRQPNALTEFAILNVDPMDAFVEKVMEGKGEAQAKIFKASKAQVRNARAEIRTGESEIKKLRARSQKVEAELSRLRRLQSGGDRAEGHFVQGIQRRQTEATEIASRIAEHRTTVSAAREREATAMAQVTGDLQAHLEHLDMKGLQRSHVISKTKSGLTIGADRRVKFYEVETTAKKEQRTFKNIMERLRNWESGDKALGQYSNYKMTLDSWLNSTGAVKPEDMARIEALEQSSGLKYYRHYWTLGHEATVDSTQLAQSGLRIKVAEGMPEIGEAAGEGYRTVKLADFQRQSLREILTNMTMRRHLGIETPGMDPYMLSERLAKSGAMGFARDIYGELQQKGLNIPKTLEEMLQMPGSDSRAVMSHMENAFVENMRHMYGEEVFDDTGKLIVDPLTGKIPDMTLGGKAQEFVRGIQLPEGVSEFGRDYQAFAQDTMGAFDEAIARHTYDAKGVIRELAGSLDETSKVDWSSVEADLLERFQPYLEAGGKVGPEIEKRMAAVMAEAHRTGRYGMLALSGGPVSMSELARRAEVAARHYVGGWKDEGQRALWREELGKKITAEDFGVAIEAKRGALGLGRKAAEEARLAAGAAEKVKGVTAQPLERLSMAALKGLNTRSGRWAAAGVGVLGALGVLRAVRNKDRTIDDLQGPPNLPGGNPYTGPVARGFDLSSSYQGPPGGGVVYDIRARGGDTGRFMNQASRIVRPNSARASYHDAPSLESPDHQRERLMAGIQ